MPSDAPLLPRVWIVSQEVPTTAWAGGLLLYRFFKDYPADRLAITGRTPPASGLSLPIPYRVFRPFLERLESTRLARFARTASALGLRRWEPAPRPPAGFRPDLVLSVMQTHSWFSAAARAARRQRVPLALIVHDEPEEFDRCHAWARPRLLRENARIYRQAAARLCISPEMERHLATQYGAPGEVLYPNRDESIRPRALEESRRLREDGTLTLGYAGGLVYGYGDRLRALAPQLASWGARLRIYSRHQPDFADGQRVVYGGFFADSGEMWARVQTECDAVVLPYSAAEDAHQRLYRTHFPSKLPEYLALGMPVVVLGPAYATGVRWAQSHPDAAACVEGDREEALAALMHLLREQPEARLRWARGAALGDADFAPAALHRKFLEALARAAAVQP